MAEEIANGRRGNTIQHGQVKTVCPEPLAAEVIGMIELTTDYQYDTPSRWDLRSARSMLVAYADSKGETISRG